MRILRVQPGPLGFRWRLAILLVISALVQCESSTYHTVAGDIVCEPFSGSGSQIIAVKRWEKFTGRRDAALAHRWLRQKPSGPVGGEELR